MRLMFYRYVMYRVNFPGAKKRCLKHRYFFAPFSNVAFNQELCAWGVHYDSSKDYTNMFYNSQSCTISGGTPQSSLGPWCSCMNTESPTSSPTRKPSSTPSQSPSRVSREFLQLTRALVSFNLLITLLYTPKCVF